MPIPAPDPAPPRTAWAAGMVTTGAFHIGLKKQRKLPSMQPLLARGRRLGCGVGTVGLGLAKLLGQGEVRCGPL